MDERKASRKTSARSKKVRRKVAKRALRQVPEPENELSRLEMEVMDVVWRLGECSSSEVVDTFAERRPLAPTTVRTVLGKLRSKGYVEAVPTIERTLHLRPAIERGSVIRRTLERLRESLFGGSPKEAIAYLLGTEEMSEEEFSELQAMIDARREKGTQE